VLDDPAEAERYLEYIADRTDLRARGERVALLRLLGRLDEAEREGRQAYEVALREGAPRHQVAALIRLAHVIQWQRNWNRADELFGNAIERARRLDDPLMLALAYQHAGRNHVDQGRLPEAVAAFRGALALREAHDAPPDQLESTRDALRAAESRIS
jgi:tetratricopeptide (TPR) repeat protein